jgi:hypothetical protein
LRECRHSASKEGEIVDRQIAICWLLLKGDHWVPVSPERRMTARDRSSPDGPVIMVELVAEVEGTRIVGWRKRIGAIFRDVAPDGEVLPLDIRPALFTAGSSLADLLVSAPGVIGINNKLAERSQGRAEVTRAPSRAGICARTNADT